MATETPTSDHFTTELASLRRLIGPLRARTRILIDAARIEAGELKTLAAHARQAKARREHSRTRANLVFAHGARAETLGYLDLDDYAILGLETHGTLYALWLADAASQNPATNRGGLLRIIFADPTREQWCRQEGARVAWVFAKAARDAETALFNERQARGASRAWRKDPATARQLYLMELIAVRGGFPAPRGLKCGPAHDWIAINGGHPDFWNPPDRAPEWRSLT